MKDYFNVNEKFFWGYELRKFSSIDEAFSHASSNDSQSLICKTAILDDERFVEMMINKLIEGKEYDYYDADREDNEEPKCRADNYELINSDFFLKSSNGYYYTCFMGEIADVRNQQELFDELGETYDFAGLVKEVEKTIAEMDSIREQYEKVELYCSSYHTFKSRLKTPEFINCLDYILNKHGLPSYWGSNKDIVEPSQA